MANITCRTNKSGDVSYLIRVFVAQETDGRQITKSMTWKPPASMRLSAAGRQAEKEAVLFEQKVKSGLMSIDGKMRFADYAARWMETAELAPATREQYKNLLKRVYLGIGYIPLEKLRAEHIQTFLANLRKEDKLSPRTIRHHHTVIRAILTCAKKAHIIPYNVAQEFMEAPKLPREEARFLNDEEAQTFLSNLMQEPDIRVKTALTLGLFTGMRRGELCGLSWNDIDFKGKVIHVRKASQYIPGQGVIEVPTKNRSSTRDITVSPFVISLLTEYRSWWLERRLMQGNLWKGEKERLFIQEDGSPIFPGTINFWLKKFTERNGLPKINPHALRHTFITLQITAGVDIRTLQARSGHAQASTLLNVYSHSIRSAQERAAQAMDEVLLGAHSTGEQE